MVWLQENPYLELLCMSLEMSVPLPTPEGPTTTKAQGRGAASSDAISTPEDSFWPMGLGIRVATVLASTPAL